MGRYVRTRTENGTPNGEGQNRPPEYAPEDEFIIRNPVSESRKARFLAEFKKDRKQTATTEMLFGRVDAFRLEEGRRSPTLISTGYKVVLFKGPFVDGSNWAPHRARDFATAMERHLLGRLEQEFREAVEGRSESAVNRDDQSVLDAMEDMAGQLRLDGYEPTLFVLAGELGFRLRADLLKNLVPQLELESSRTLRNTYRILGAHGPIPILGIAESPSPALYAVDLAGFAELVRYGDEPEFKVTEFTREAAAALLAQKPSLISRPAPSTSMEGERIRQLRLRVGLDLRERYELIVNSREAVIGRPLVGEVED